MKLKDLSMKNTEKHNNQKDVVSMNKDDATPVDFPDIPTLSLGMGIPDKDDITIREIVDALQAAKNRGENVYYEFTDGIRFYSADATVENVWSAIKEWYAYMDLFSELKKTKAFVENNVPKLWARSDALIDPSKKEIWHEFVEENIAGDHGKECIMAMIEFMEKIQNGATPQEISKLCMMKGFIFMDQVFIVKSIGRFCKNGDAFAKEVMNIWLSEENKQQDRSGKEM